MNSLAIGVNIFLTTLALVGMQVLPADLQVLHDCRSLHREGHGATALFDGH